LQADSSSIDRIQKAADFFTMSGSLYGFQIAAQQYGIFLLGDEFFLKNENHHLRIETLLRGNSKASFDRRQVWLSSAINVVEVCNSTKN
jgi:hypothetical protein